MTDGTGQRRRPASEIIREAALLFATHPDAGDLPARLCALIDSLGGGIQAEFHAEALPSASRSGSAIPVSFLGTDFGSLAIATVPSRPLDPAEIEVVQTCAYYFATRLYDEHLRAKTERLERLVAIDTLTGVANRYAFDQTLAAEWNRMRRDGKPLSLLLLDVDFFKGFNDSYGHVAGDTCLRAVAQAAAKTLRRPGDLFARYGGEEFAAVLPDTDAAGAQFIAAEILKAVEALNMPYEASSLGRVSASIGIASRIPDNDDDTALISCADEALYHAKRAGRNRFCRDGAASHGPQVRLRRGGSLSGVPSVRTKFIGRTRELDELAHLVEDYRLVTIAGPGGVGKTRTVVELARRLTERFPDGVYFVDLAGASAPEHVCSAIAAAFEPRFGRLSFERLLEQLGSEHLLLILDNCENALGGSAQAANRLLDAGSDVRIIATSREPLRAPGERLLRLSGLPAADALDLLVSRVSISEQETQDGRRLVERLDGLPLAIELAAGRLANVGAAGVLAQVEERLDALRPQKRETPQRQQTVEGLVEWSYRLLSDAERYVLDAVSVFRGGFTIDAAVAVCQLAGLNPKQVRDHVAALESKSLVERYETLGQVRLRLLETTQTFAAARLKDERSEQEIRKSHAQWVTQWAQESAVLFQTMHRRRWIALQQLESENVRAALRWVLHDARDVSWFASMVRALQFWIPYMQPGADEMREFVDEAMETLDLPASRAALLLARCDLGYFSDTKRAWEDAKSALAVFETTQDAAATMYALELCMWCELAVTGTVHPSILEPLLRAANSAEKQRMLRTAAQLFNAAAIVREKTGGGTYEDVKRIYQRSLDLAERIGDPALQAGILGSLFRIEYERGRYDDAIPLALRAIALSEPAQEKREVCVFFLILARAEIRRRNFVAARIALRKAIELPTTPLFMMQYAGATFDTGAALAQAVGQTQRAALLVGAGDEFSRHAQHREPYDQHEIDEVAAAVRAQLGDEEFGRQRSLGEALGVDEAIAETLLV